MFPYFQVFGKIIGSYALCAIAGLLLCGVVASVLAKRFRIAYEDVVLMMVVIGVSLLIGGHILFGITNMNQVIALVKEASSYSIKQFFAHLGRYFGGMVFYGGFLGACAGLFLYTGKSKSVERGTAFDLFAVSIPLFHVFGRIGCFLSGCCYGVESSFGFVVTGNPLVPELNGVRRLPVPLIEAACNLVIFLVLLRLFLKGRKNGRLIWYYMLIYPVVRFLLEFFRGDAVRGFLFGLSTSQWISIGLFAAAVWKLFLSKGRLKAAGAGVLLFTLLVAGTAPQTAYAEGNASQTVTEAPKQGQENTNAANDPQENEAENKAENGSENKAENGPETPAKKEPPFNAKEKFVVFVCCLFSVVLCLVIALWGNPNDRLKEKYKQARKQQMLQEKQKKEREERAARHAAEDARYAEEMIKYEERMKALEAEKAERRAAKANKRSRK